MEIVSGVVFADVTFRAERSDNRKYVCERRLQVNLSLLFSAIFSPFCSLREIKDNSIYYFIFLLFNCMKRPCIKAF